MLRLRSMDSLKPVTTVLSGLCLFHTFFIPTLLSHAALSKITCHLTLQFMTDVRETSYWIHIFLSPHIFNPRVATDVSSAVLPSKPWCSVEDNLGESAERWGLYQHYNATLFCYSENIANNQSDARSQRRGMVALLNSQSMYRYGQGTLGSIYMFARDRH